MMEDGASLYDLGFGDKQYMLVKTEGKYLFFDKHEGKKCLEICQKVADRIHGLLSIQAAKNRDGDDLSRNCYEIYKDANCHGTAIYTLGHCGEDEREKLDIDGDIFVYDDKIDQKKTFEETYLKPYTPQLLHELSLPIGIHFTDIFQRHSAILLGEDERNPKYYVSFQKIAYAEPRVIASFRKEILDLRKGIWLMPNNYK